ncbi:MAG TPA: hypothetical protein VLA36_10530 [Longimicrobiales bacterium]|nr:hypothetical protein [Longimicrobiales bacterium]
MTTLTTVRRFLLSILAMAGTLSGCLSSTEGELDTFAGEWCTLRGLGSDNLPASGVAYVGATLLEEGGRVLGTGSTSRPGSDEVFPARFRGDITGGQAVIEVSDIEVEPDVPGPHFTMVMRVTGVRDMEGTMAGDPDFVGPIRLVRLGPRCFVE